MHNNHPITASQIHDYPTRFSSANKCFIPNKRSHKHSTTKTPTHQASFYATKQWALWNALPLELREIPNRGSFGGELKAWLLAKQ